MKIKKVVVKKVVAEPATEKQAERSVVPACSNCGDSGKACVTCHAGDLVE